MSGRTIVRGALALLLLGTLSAAPAGTAQTRPDAQASIRSLRAQLAAEKAHSQELTQRLAKATQRLADLQKQLEAARAAAAIMPVPVQPDRQIPEGWQMRRFNGITYYVVPLDAPINRVTPANR